MSSDRAKRKNGGGFVQWAFFFPEGKESDFLAAQRDSFPFPLDFILFLNYSFQKL